MWLLAFSVLAMIVGADIRRRGFETRRAEVCGSTANLAAEDAIAIGAWVNFLGSICLNIAVWHVF